jgi:hypothetical protein
MTRIQSLMLAALVAATAPPLAVSDTAQTTTAGDALHAARYDSSRHLVRPSDLDRWVFLGASLGMNYNDAAFSVEHPGAFQVVLMEPSAYEYFLKHGRYADGSMFLLSFYDTQRGVSIDRAGFVPGALSAFEIHLIDRARYTEGHAFFPFAKEAGQSEVLPPGSACVKCHVPKGAYDGTFTQFYPAIRERVPAKSSTPETK